MTLDRTAFGWTRRSTCSRRRDAKVDARIVLGLRSGAAVRRIRLISWSRPSARGGPVNDSLTMGSQDISRSVVHAIMGLRASRAERRQENPRPHGALKRRAAANEVELSSSMRRIAGGCRCGGWHRDELDDLRPDSIGLGPGDPPCSRRRAAKVDAQIVLRFQTGPSTASTWPWARQSGRTPGTGHDRRGCSFVDVVPPTAGRRARHRMVTRGPGRRTRVRLRRGCSTIAGPAGAHWRRAASGAAPGGGRGRPWCATAASPDPSWPRSRGD
jgi:hypothetical protein